MGKQIDRAISSLVDEALQRESSSGTTVSSQELSEIRARLFRSYQQDALEEFKAEYGEEVRRQIQSEEQTQAEKNRAIQLVRHTKSLLFEGIFVAFLVGVIVNQVTYILSYIDEHSSVAPLVLPCCFLGGAVLVLVLMVSYRLVALSVKLFSEVNHSK